MLLKQCQLLHTHTVPGIKHMVTQSLLSFGAQWNEESGLRRGREVRARWQGEEARQLCSVTSLRDRSLLHGTETDTYLFHVGLSHVNVGVHLLKVLLCSVCLFTVPLELSFSLTKQRKSNLI